MSCFTHLHRKQCTQSVQICALHTQHRNCEADKHRNFFDNLPIYMADNVCVYGYISNFLCLKLARKGKCDMKWVERHTYLKDFLLS